MLHNEYLRACMICGIIPIGILYYYIIDVIYRYSDNITMMMYRTNHSIPTSRFNDIRIETSCEDTAPIPYSRQAAVAYEPRSLPKVANIYSLVIDVFTVY